MFPVANVPHIFHKYVLYNAKIVDKQEKNGKNEDYNYIFYNVYLHYQNVANKNMVEKKLFAKTLPVLLGFFVMGFCDIVGISNVFSKGSLWMAYNL